MRPDAIAVSSLLSGAGVHAVLEETSLGAVCRLAQPDTPAALFALRGGDLEFRMLVDLFGIDTSEEIEITYHMRSFVRDEELFVKARVEYGAEVVSVWNVFASALMPERELAELFGLMLRGHPNPKRLFTTDGVPPLLLKDQPIRTLEEVRNR